MSKTATQRLQEQFEEYDIENTIAQLPQEAYNEFQKMASRMLELLKAN